MKSWSWKWSDGKLARFVEYGQHGHAKLMEKLSLTPPHLTFILESGCYGDLKHGYHDCIPMIPSCDLATFGNPG